MKYDARFHTFKILRIFSQKPDRLNIIRDNYIRRYNISQNEISRILVLTNEVVRWELRLDGWINSKLDKSIKKLNPDIRIILRLGYYEALMDDLVPQHAAVHSWVELTKRIVSKKLAGLVNALLRKTNEIDSNSQPGKMSHSDWLSFPSWLVKKWTSQYGEKNTKELCSYFNSIPYIDVRINRWQNKLNDIEKLLDDLGISWTFSPKSKNFIRITKGIQSLLKNDVLKSGKVSIQDRASGAVVELLNPQPDEIILDVCAAPGTKTNYIVEKMKGKGLVFASDISLDRMKKGAANIEQSNYPIEWSCKDGSKDQYPMADRILIDAPCTGTGVIGRRPDIRLRRKKDHAELMSLIQLQIINHMVQYLKPNGVLVYATCSLEMEENWDVVQAFLKLNNDYVLESGKDFIPNSWLNKQNCLATFPPRDKVDGMFAARFRNYVK